MMKTPIRFLFVLLVLFGLPACQEKRVEPLPDEKKVAMERLVKSQSGPEYFRAQGSAAAEDENGEVWLDVVAAREQVERIVRERSGDGAMKDRILRMIEDASEPHPSRAVGGERVSVAKLNVALDALP